MTLVGLGRGTREKERIKVRQPLEGDPGRWQIRKHLIGDLTPLIKEELNVKDVRFREANWTIT